MVFTTEMLTRGVRWLAERVGSIACPGEQLTVTLADLGVAMKAIVTGDTYLRS